MANDVNGGLKNLLPGNIDALNKVYSSVELANLAIPNILIGGISFRLGKIVQIGTDINHEEYRWIGGYENSNLKRNIALNSVIYNPTLQVSQYWNGSQYITFSSGNTNPPVENTSFPYILPFNLQ